MDRLVSSLSKFLGGSEAITIEVDQEGVALSWIGIEHVPNVVTFLAKLIAHQHHLEALPNLELVWQEGDSREVQVEEVAADKFAERLVEWWQIPCLDILRLIVKSKDISIPIRFEGTASMGMVVLFLESPNHDAIRHLAGNFSGDTTLRFQSRGG